MVGARRLARLAVALREEAGSSIDCDVTSIPAKRSTSAAFAPAARRRDAPEGDVLRPREPLLLQGARRRGVLAAEGQEVLVAPSNSLRRTAALVAACRWTARVAALVETALYCA